MAKKKEATEIITLQCQSCKQNNYTSRKNRKTNPDRLERKKYCRFERKHTLHKEVK
ncbi:50S ribosomal protein L33 [Candidatus Omnitrophota bacterium]